MRRTNCGLLCTLGSVLMPVGIAWGTVTLPDVPTALCGDPPMPCETGGGIPCSTNGDCDYPGPCYDGSCVAGECVFLPACSDGLGCTVDTCVGGVCVHTPDDALCDDGLVCTQDECDVGAGACVHLDRNELCNVDNLYCTDDYCDPVTGFCRVGIVSPCEAPTPACDEANDRCVECIGDPNCEDNVDRLSCDTGSGVCVECLGNPDCAAPKPFCVDGECEECLTVSDCEDIACMDEECWTDNTCHHIDTCAVQDGQFCNGVETCNTGTGLCEPGTPPCGGQDCDEQTHECTGCSDDEDCPDDGHPCTTSTCNTSSGICETTTDDSVCDDDVFCNGAETCDAAAGCIAGTPPCSAPTPSCFEEFDRCGNCKWDANCDNGVACTDDTCVDNLCVHTDNCNDADSCDGIDTCNTTTGQCETTGAPPDCGSDYCLESQCVECVFGHASGPCASDGYPCTEDRCLSNNTCVYVPDSDGDGVPNCCDNCPDSPAGEGVYGCTTSNPEDPNCVCDDPLVPACPGAPAVEGCACSELDYDGDGLDDCHDSSPCP